MTYVSTKTYGHEVGLSCAFRQWRAKSHCRFIHGYALAVRLEFEAEVLDEHGWVIDFGSLKSIKEWLQDKFDHKLIVAEDDPDRYALQDLEVCKIADITLLSDVGCEFFARYIHDKCVDWLNHSPHATRVWMKSVEVREHGANSAIYRGTP